MKKFYMILVLVVCQLAARAQPYEPMLDSVANNWYYTSSVIPVRAAATTLTDCSYPSFFTIGANYMSTIGDTTFNGFTYLALKSGEQLNPQGDCFFGYLREDVAARKVYFVDNQFGAEKLIYDFSMVPGDSIYLEFVQSGSFYETGYFTLDSIGSVNILAGQRRSFFLSNHAQLWTPGPLQWVESVGFPGHLVYTHSANFMGGLFSFIQCPYLIVREFYQQLTCFDHGPVKVYFDSCMHSYAYNNFCFYYQDSCFYYNICGSLDENSLLGDMVISPNPGSGKFVVAIEAGREMKADLIIYSAQGQKIQSRNSLKLLQGKSEHQLDLSTLPPGIYIAEMKLKEGSIFRKVIISEKK